MKVRATTTNALAFLNVQEEFGLFDKYIWQFTDYMTIQNSPENKGIAVSFTESDAKSKDLKIRGFKFVGTTICYAFMQAAGMVNDHLEACFRNQEIQY